MRDIEKVFFIVLFVMVSLVVLPYTSYAGTEYRELHRTSIQMRSGKYNLFPSERQKIYNFFVEVKRKLNGRALDSELVVIGYANNTGGKSYDNQNLADKRAKTVKDFIEGTYAGDPAKKIPGLKVDHAFGKVQGQEYNGVVNRFNTTGVLVILSQNVNNYPFDSDDIFEEQYSRFNSLDKENLMISVKLSQLNEVALENNKIIKNDKKVAAAMHEASEVLKSKQLLILIFAGMVMVVLLLILLWPNSKSGYTVVVDNGNVDDHIRRIGTKIEQSHSSNEVVERQVREVATGVKSIQENLTVLKVGGKSTNQEEYDVRNLLYNSEKYIIHLENDDGQLISPFRRPKKGMRGEYIKFYGVSGARGAENQVKRIFARAQNEDDKLYEHWKSEIERLINNPLFEGPRLIQQENDK
jgi:hypothetical protein